MAELITLGEMVISGRLDLRTKTYTQPFVKVRTPDNDELNVEIEELSGAVVLRVPYRYREASYDYDVPQFWTKIVQVADGEEEVFRPLDSIQFRRSEISRQWSYHDGEFRLALDPATFSITRKAKRLVFEVTMGVRLTEYAWSEIGPPGGYRPPTSPPKPKHILFQEKKVTLSLVVNSLAQVCIESFWSPSDVDYSSLHDNWLAYPSGDETRLQQAIAKDRAIERDMFATDFMKFGLSTEPGLSSRTLPVIWEPKSSYRLYFRITNASTHVITGWNIRFSEDIVRRVEGGAKKFERQHHVDEDELPNDEQRIEPGCSKVVWSNTFQPPSDDPQFEHFDKHWAWYRAKEVPHWTVGLESGEALAADSYFEIMETYRRFNYLSTGASFEFEGKGGEFEFPDPGAITAGHAGVFVPPWKIEAIQSYGRTEAGEAGADMALDIVGLVIAVASFGAGSIAGIVLGILGITANVGEEVVGALDGANENWLQRANDPLEFDANYRDVHDFRALVPPPETGKSVELTTFSAAYQRAVALNSSINITFVRLMSALAKEDNVAAQAQKEISQAIAAIVGEELAALSEKVDAVKRQLIAEPEAIESIDSIIAKISREGLPQAVKDDKLAEGYSQEQLDTMVAAIARYTAHDLLRSQEAQLDAIQLYICERYADSQRVAKEIKRVWSSSARYVLQELRNLGLVSAEEYSRRIAATPDEQYLPIGELKIIDELTGQRLESFGTSNTMQLLGQCESRSSRERLAKLLQVSAQDVLEWANRADLMRVEGITGRHADTLENVGVDTVVELGTRNSEHLYEKIKEYGETQRAAISVTQKQIETWTQLARKLPKRLKH